MSAKIQAVDEGDGQHDRDVGAKITNSATKLHQEKALMVTQEMRVGKQCQEGSCDLCEYQEACLMENKDKLSSQLKK